MHSLLAPFLVAIYSLTLAFTITPQPTHLCDLLGEQNKVYINVTVTQKFIYGIHIYRSSIYKLY